ncbi:MAG TPA: hypothetical protein VGM25_03235 [Caulobacteraceae bacterium]|jgi:hypothetical protein
MGSLYSVKAADDGWFVYEVRSGEVLTLDGREQAGLSLEQAEQVADQLNGEAVAWLMGSVANDDHQADRKPW